MPSRATPDPARCLLLAAALAALHFSGALAETPAPTAPAQTQWKFAFAPAQLPGFTSVPLDARFSETSPFGYDNAGGSFPAAAGDHITTGEGGGPVYFSVNLPEGNYKVTVHLGGSDEGDTTVKAELRRLMLENIHTAPGQTLTKTFAVSVRQPPIIEDGKQTGMTRVKAREGSAQRLNRTQGGEGWSWDDSLTLEFSGKPAVQGIEIEPAGNVTQVFLCGDSTMCDQPAEPYTSWGQVITRWFKPDAVVTSLAISGETMPAFLGENRLTKIISMMHPGDFVLVQFGHNDMKSPAQNALDTYKKNLQRFISETKDHGGIPVIITPVSRETFGSDGKITNSFITKSGDDYVKACRDVADQEHVTLLDLNADSATLYEAVGPAHSQPLFATPAEKTHHSDYGSYEIAKCVVQEIVNAKLPLAEHLTDDWKPFDPAHPDPQPAVNLPPDPAPRRFNAPAGN
ncbi:MAG TPA: rhamnogalacturonan acetylesterase [Phycisphaerae bacterium]|nr:rhamnogalacturonan acetylesterase [Phycisphaerae bacterium]